MAKKKIEGAAPVSAAESKSKVKSSAETRYQKVKRILNDAAGSSTVSYQGLGRFWNLPYAEFIDVEIYGYRMIAQVNEMHSDEILIDPDDPCCPPPLKKGNPDTRVQMTVRPGRGAASALIKGLKGEFPFNQEYFKPLPWGGRRLTDTEIAFIEKWIDDGCPEHDTEAEFQKLQASAKGLVFKAYQGATNIFKREHKQLKVRKCIDNLNPQEEYKLRAAFWELIRLNVFPKDKRNMLYWGRLHGDECQHGWEQFLTWHRMFLYSFEQALQDIDPDVTLPYWDWTEPAYLGGQIPSKLDPKNPYYNKDGISGVIPKALRCWLNQAAIVKITKTGLFSKKDIANMEAIKGIRYNSAQELFTAAKISDQTQRNAIYPELTRVNALWYQFRYPGMFYNPSKSSPLQTNSTFDGSNPLGVAGLQNFNHHFPTKEDVKRIMEVDNWRDFGGGPIYDQSFGILDMDPHNTIHLWTGGNNPNYYFLQCNPNNSALAQDPNEPRLGDMFNNLTAAFDPIFWPHHVNIDRIFHNWQRKYPNQVPDDLTSALPGLGFAVRDALSTGKLGYEYAYDSHIYPTGRNLALSSLNCESIPVTDALRSFDGRVELRLHQVDQPQYSYGVRVFLNQPSANEETPIQGNPHYAGYFSFFGHGECIGGPGHCDPPPVERRENDIRVRHHNAPGNIRLDITEAFKRLAAKSDKIEVSLVLFGSSADDGASAISMDALSINFID